MQEKNSSITSARDAVFLRLLKMLGLLLVKLAAWSDTWFIQVRILFVGRKLYQNRAVLLMALNFDCIG